MIYTPISTPCHNEVFEMAACGNTHGMYLVVWTNDSGWIPHFHIFNNPNPSKATFDACLKLETPEYFKHEQHTDVLNSKQMKHLVELLQKEIKPGLTYWQQLIISWNMNNSKSEIPYDMQMPDYNSLISNENES